MGVAARWGELRIGVVWCGSVWGGGVCVPGRGKIVPGMGRGAVGWGEAL